MKCEWRNGSGHREHGDVAVCIIGFSSRIPNKRYWLTCKTCRNLLENDEDVQFITEDLDMMVCYEVLDS